jgi:hypothetical protein
MLSSAPPAIKVTQSITRTVTSTATKSCFTIQKPANAVAAMMKQRVKSQRIASVLPICDRQRIVYAAAPIPNSLNKACMPTRSCS